MYRRRGGGGVKFHLASSNRITRFSLDPLPTRKDMVMLSNSSALSGDRKAKLYPDVENHSVHQIVSSPNQSTHDYFLWSVRYRAYLLASVGAPSRDLSLKGRR